MQKKRLAIMLCFVLSVNILTGCTGAEVPKDSSLESVNSTQTESNSKETEHKTETGEIQEPIETQEPSEIQTPEVTQTPGETQEPEKTQTPGETQESSESQEPGETQKPSQSQKPSGTQTPGQTTNYTFSEMQKEVFSSTYTYVYDKPEYKNSKCLTSIEKDTRFTITGQCNETNWYRVLYDGQIGYIDEAYKEKLTAADAIPAAPKVKGWDKVPDFTGKNYTAKDMAQIIVNCIIPDGMTDFEKALEIHDWMTFHIDYDYTYSRYSAKEALLDRTCVCQGYAEAFELLAELAGLDATFVAGTATNSAGSTGGHAWNQVKVNGTWYNVDVTWDDPANPGKDPNDHKYNRYDYFLISDEQLQKNHTPERWNEEKHTCAKTYDRTTVYKAAIESGVHGDGVFVQSVEEANAAIKKYMDNEKTTVTLWGVRDYLEGVKYAFELQKSQSTGMDGISKMSLSIYKSSEWNAIPVVTNAEEFQALLKAKRDAGVTSFTGRCESPDGDYDFVRLDFSETYYNSMNRRYYNNGNSVLFTIMVE